MIVTGTWQSITLTGNTSTTIQNKDYNYVRVAFDTTTPTSDNIGYILTPLGTEDSSLKYNHILGTNMYVRCDTGTCTIDVEGETAVGVQLGAPTIAPNGGSFNYNQEVTLTDTSGESAEIYYTTNGTNPSKGNGILYTAPFAVGEEYNRGEIIVKATAVKEGFLPSVVTTSVFNISTEYSLLNKPQNLTQSFPINIYESESGFINDFDITDYELTGGVTYYVSKSGDNGNDGLSVGTAFRDFITAYNKIDVGTILFDDGVYDRQEINLGAELTVSKDLNIKAINPNAVSLVMGDNDYTWLVTAGHTNVYEITRTNATRVIKFNGINSYEFTEVASIADVDTTINSWFTDGSLVYINDNNGVPDTANVHVVLGIISNFIFKSSIYLENIRLEGGLRTCSAERDASNISFYANACEFNYSENNGFRAVDVDESYLYNCSVKGYKEDGYNYHRSVIDNMKFMELECSGGNGGSGVSDQVSTAHDGIEGIRYKCVYDTNNEDIVTDINTGTVTWNVNCDNKNGLITDWEVYDFATMILYKCYRRSDTVYSETQGGVLYNINPIDI